MTAGPHSLGPPRDLYGLGVQDRCERSGQDVLPAQQSPALYLAPVPADVSPRRTGRAPCSGSGEATLPVRLSRRIAEVATRGRGRLVSTAECRAVEWPRPCPNFHGAAIWQLSRSHHPFNGKGSLYDAAKRGGEPGYLEQFARYYGQPHM